MPHTHRILSSIVFTSREIGRSFSSQARLELGKPLSFRPSFKQLTSFRIFVSREDSALNNMALGKHISHYWMDFRDFAARRGEIKRSVCCAIRPQPG